MPSPRPTLPVSAAHIATVRGCIVGSASFAHVHGQRTEWHEEALAALDALAARIDTLDVLVREATFVVTGTIEHLYLGGCPDSVEGPELRDPDCPACQWIDAARAALADGAA
jgi:hypothetical protein